MELNRTQADLGLLLVGILWGLGFVFVKIGLNEGIDTMYLLTIRFLLGALALVLVFKKQLKKFTKEDIKAGIILSLFQILGYLFQTLGLEYTTAGKNAFFTSINVVIVPYIFWLIHKKRPDLFSFVASIICILGVGIISFDNNFNLTELNYGDILTIVCAFCFAGQIAFTGYFSKKVNPMNLILLQMLIPGIVYLISMLFIKGLSAVKMLDGMALISVIYIIIFSTTIPTILQTLCQRATTSTRASILLSTESLFAPLFAFFILGEILTIKTLIGAGLILFSVIVSETKLGLVKIKEE